MYSYAKNVGVPAPLVREAPAFAVSFLVAELLDKCHRLSLERLAFLVTWCVPSRVQSLVIRPGRRA